MGRSTRWSEYIGRSTQRCLFTSSDWFSMNDVVRDVATSIASRELSYFCNEIRSWADTKWPDKYTSTNALKSKGLECPELECFYCDSNNSSLKIPDNIFIGMSNLSVLDFNVMQLLSLPSSSPNRSPNILFELWRNWRHKSCWRAKEARNSKLARFYNGAIA